MHPVLLAGAMCSQPAATCERTDACPLEPDGLWRTAIQLDIIPGGFKALVMGYVAGAAAHHSGTQVATGK